MLTTVLFRVFRLPVPSLKLKRKDKFFPMLH